VALRIYLPLLLLGACAGLVHAIGQRATTPRRRRAFQITWILMILLGAPLWLFVAAALGWI
jgi:hypothetical protein